MLIYIFLKSFNIILFIFIFVFSIVVVFVIRGSSHGSSVCPVQLTSTCRASCSYRVHPMGSPWYHTSTPWCPPPSHRQTGPSDFFASADRRSRSQLLSLTDQIFVFFGLMFILCLHWLLKLGSCTLLASLLVISYVRRSSLACTACLAGNSLISLYLLGRPSLLVCSYVR